MSKDRRKNETPKRKPVLICSWVDPSELDKGKIKKPSAAERSKKKEISALKLQKRVKNDQIPRPKEKKKRAKKIIPPAKTSFETFVAPFYSWSCGHWIICIILLCVIYLVLSKLIDVVWPVENETNPKIVTLQKKTN